MIYSLCPCQAFNWLLCNVIQTTCLHDILWHFVASLTPSPFEPDDEEEDENKGNKENVEQVMSGYESNSKQQLICFFDAFSNVEQNHIMC